MADTPEETPTVFTTAMYDMEGTLLHEGETTDTPEEMTWEGRSFVRTEVSESHVRYDEVPGEAPTSAE